MCKEVENNSASVPPKEEVSTQVLISSIFCEDPGTFLRNPGLNFENICYSFKTEIKPHWDNLWWKKKPPDPKMKSFGMSARRKGQQVCGMRVGMVGRGSGTGALTGSRQKHLKEEGICDEPPGIAFWEKPCAWSVRYTHLSLTTLHQTLSYALQTLNAHHSEKQYHLFGSGHRICHANVNFGKRHCKLPTRHLCKHISNYLLVRCTVKKSFL